MLEGFFEGGEVDAAPFERIVNIEDTARARHAKDGDEFDAAVDAGEVLWIEKNDDEKHAPRSVIYCGLQAMRVLQAVNVHPDIERKLRKSACNGQGQFLAVPVVRDHEVEAAYA